MKRKHNYYKLKNLKDINYIKCKIKNYINNIKYSKS